MINRIESLVRSDDPSQDLTAEKPEYSHEDFSILFDIPSIFKEIEDAYKIREVFVENVTLRKVSIKNLRNPDYVLKDELIIHLENENDMITAIAYDIGQYGQGVSEEDAIQDLCETIVEYYILLSNEEKMSKQLKAHYNFLRGILIRT